MNVGDEVYLNGLRELVNLASSVDSRKDRTNTGTFSVFGRQERYDISKYLPLLVSKNVHFKSVLGELLWFISGSTNVKDLQALGVTIWDEWADPVTGELPETYSKQWSRYEDVRIVSAKDTASFVKKHPGFQYTGIRDDDNFVYKRVINQVTNLVKSIKENPTSRRHILNGWNVQTADEAALPPCHVLYQFYVQEGKLSCQLYMRSSDIFLGRPFNIASASLLTYMLAQQCDLEPGELIMTYGDAHLYTNHVEQAKTQLAREEEALTRSSPTLVINKKESILDYKPEDFTLIGYNPMGTIKAPVAV